MSQVRVKARPCPVCGSTRRSFAVSAPGDWLDKEHPVPDAEYPYYHCLDCEAVYLGNLPSTETLSAYYEAPTYHVRHASLTGDRPDRVAPAVVGVPAPGASHAGRPAWATSRLRLRTGRLCGVRTVPGLGIARRRVFRP